MENNDNREGSKEKTSPNPKEKEKKRWFGRKSTTRSSFQGPEEVGALLSNEINEYNANREHSIIDPIADSTIPDDAVEDTGADRGSQKLQPSQPVTYIRPTVLGKVIFIIHEIRFLAIQNAKFITDLDGNGTHLPLAEVSFPLKQELEFADISSDLKIKFRGTHMISKTPMTGYVVVPLAQSLSAFGRPRGIPQKWYLISPFYDRQKLGEPKNLTKFRSCYPEINGSGLIKPSFPLGFVSLEVKVQLAPGIKSGLSLYFYPNPRTLGTQKDFFVNQLDESADSNESTLVLANARMNRDIERIKTAFFKPLAIFSPFLSFPEIFPLIMIFGFVCHSVSLLQIPFVLFGITLLNGEFSSLFFLLFENLNFLTSSQFVSLSFSPLFLLVINRNCYLFSEKL
jgi:hypothetical protein